ncbi:MAG: LysE family translocator [Pseudomonadota bacterium]
MSAEIYVAYVLACLVILIIPGPTILLIVTYALREGRRAALWTVVGVGLGDLTALVMSLAGLGALLAISSELFTIVKWLGAAYLVYLGVKLWREYSPIGGDPIAQARTPSGISMMSHAWLVTALNPKGIVFFVAFLPQFVDPAHAVTPQLTLLGMTFLVLAIANAALYAFAAERLSGHLRGSWLPYVNRIGGSVLIGAGVMTALSGAEAKN